MLGSQTLILKTFAESTPKLQTCEVVQLCKRSLDGLNIYTTCYVVPQICHPVSCQVIDIAKAQYSYLQGLLLDDNPTAEEQNEMAIDILVGSDQYWAFREGSIIQGDLPGPVATLTKLEYVLSRSVVTLTELGYVLSGSVATLTELGHVLSGPVHCQGNNQFSINFVSTHVLKTDAQPIEDDINLNNELSRFWELEHIGIQKQKPSVYDKFFSGY